MNLSFKQITLTLIVLFCLFLTALPAQEVFWSEDFSDQEEFETTWTNGGNNPGIELWKWNDDPSTPLFGGQPEFGSTTLENGFIIFDSDSNGNHSHDVTITSGPIDCSGQSVVYLRSENQYGYYSAPSVSIAEVGVSTDGENFTYYRILENVPQNVLDEAVQIVTLELPEAVDQPEVYLQFRWRGTFEYTWRIDDIALYDADPTAANDLVIDDPRGAFNFQTPLSQSDTVFFTGVVRNIGLETQTEVQFSVDVFSESVDGFSSIFDLDEFEPGRSDTINFEEYFIPEETGIYNVTYTVSQAEEDAMPESNTVESNFVISEEWFAKDDNNIVGYAIPVTMSDDTWQIGNYYVVPNGGGFEATQVTFSVYSDGDIHQGQSVMIFLYKYVDDGDDDLTDDDLEVIGFADHTFTDEESYELVTVDLLDLLDVTPGVALEDAGEYFLILEYTEDMGAPYSSIPYYYDVATVVKNGEWFGGGFGADITTVARMRVQEISSPTREPVLSEYNIEIFPNPAKGSVRIDVDLESENKLEGLRIFDTQGKMVVEQLIEQSETSRLNVPIYDLAAGTYFVQIVTSEGIATRRLVKI